MKKDIHFFLHVLYDSFGPLSRDIMKRGTISLQILNAAPSFILGFKKI